MESVYEASAQPLTRSNSATSDSTLLEGCLEQHVEQFGRAPERVAADPGFFSAANESKAEQMRVSRVSIPSPPKPGSQAAAEATLV